MWILIAALAIIVVVVLVRRFLMHKGAVAGLHEPSGLTYSALETRLLGPPPDVRSLLHGNGREVSPRLLSPMTNRCSGLDGGSASEDGFLGHAVGGAALVDGAFPAAGYALGWAQLDHHFLDAVEQLTHKTISSIGDLHQAIDHYQGLTQLSGPTQALIDKMKGHVAEFIVHDHLVGAGHHVEMAELSNNEGWDLSADGHLMNVKAWADGGAAVARHAANYSEYSVVLAGDATNIPADALHFDPSHVIDLDTAHAAGASVFVDDALSHADAAHVTENGLDAAAGHVHLHIPWVTFAVTSLREGHLLLKGHTDVMRATKNVAVTTAAVGGGGALGAKAGAAIGTFFAPGIGTAIGALVGGVAGSFAGRKAATAIKEAPLIGAKQHYEIAVAEFEEVRTSALSRAATTWIAFESSTESTLETEARRASAEARGQIQSASATLESTRELETGNAVRVLSAARAEIDEQVETDAAAYRGLPWWRRALLPDAQTAEAWARLHRLKERGRYWRANHDSLLASFGRTVPAEIVFNLALMAPCGERAATAHLAHVAQVRISTIQQATLAYRDAVNIIVNARANAVAKLSAKQQEIIEAVNAAVAPAVASVKGARAVLVSELRKAGIDVPA